MTTEPALPEPGVQSPEDRRAISRLFIRHAKDELGQGHRLQAGEKAWGAIAQHLKIIGEQRGWNHVSQRQLESIGRHIVAEYGQPQLGNAISDAYHKGHRNFYENQTTLSELQETVEQVEEVLPLLDSLDFAAPMPFAITSGSEARRLREVTGNGALKPGDTSEVGFSLRHKPVSGGVEGAGGAGL